MIISSLVEAKKLLLNGTISGFELVITGAFATIYPTILWVKQLPDASNGKVEAKYWMRQDRPDAGTIDLADDERYHDTFFARLEEQLCDGSVLAKLNQKAGLSETKIDYLVQTI